MSKKNIIVMLTVVLALSACNSPEPAIPDELTAPPLSADQVLDNKLFEEAVDTLLVDKCEFIKNESTKKECTESLESLALIDQAVTAVDDSYCKKIALARYQEKCESDVKYALSQKDTAEKEEQRQLEQSKKTAEIIKSKNIADCDSLDLANQVSCIEAIVFSEALAKKDSSICNQLEEEESIARCQAQL